MRIEAHTLPGIPLVQEGDDLAALIETALEDARLELRDFDVLVLAQKIVSKAEGRLVDLATVKPSPKAIEYARLTEKDPRLVELILSESVGVLTAKPNLFLVEHRLGFVMPCAGIDQSNIGEPGHNTALLLPVNPDGSALRLRRALQAKYDVEVAVVINDSVSRPWRAGTCGVALGSAGLPVLNDMRGKTDLLGRELKFTVTGFADEIASAASLLMGQGSEGTPVVLMRGLQWKGLNTRASELLLRPTEVTPEHIASL